MIWLDGIFTYFILWLKKHSVPKLFYRITILYFAWNPLIVRYAITMWKDIPFSGIWLLLVLFLYDIANQEESTSFQWFRIIFLSILSAFVRNRVIYLVVLAFISTLILTTPVFREVRYMFVFHLTLPSVVMGLLMGEKLRKRDCDV